ncbi:HPr(Ser) kinase/phosphatase [Brassicibacter mesophilus]|jgi:HPr kinase/phosphorylase|uniref:HPr(Ser) kinase/phosphatase n=1 Tax=Brassicibacter mesophilus TaxID=745119 RepID=UPI003D2589FF
MKSVPIDKLAEDLKLEIIYMPENPNIQITRSDVNRPGLQLTGFFKYFGYERMQLIGNVEWNYLFLLDDETRQKRLDMVFEYPIPALIISRKLDVFPQIIEAAKKYNRTVLRTDIPSTKFISKLISYLDDMLAPQITMHGVLVEVYGMGILLAGKSGVGKSETALELIKRGHRLVADDAVIIRKVDEGMLKGTSPELIRHFMEIRGIGILDIERLYGVGAVKRWEAIDLVIELEHWDEKKEYDRVGLDEQYTEILDSKVPKVTIPVKPGRNLAMIVEVAARNTRQKQFGYNAAEALDRKLKVDLKENK